MERLNLRTSKPYEDIWRQDADARRRYFIVAEGLTEESYFVGVKNNRRELEICSDVHIEVVPKAEGQETMSHPLQLVGAALMWLGRLDADGNERPEDEWEVNCKWDYDAEIDRVCIIFDRDYRDLERQLDTIYDICKKHKLYVGISNPNFELWLLMHFHDINQYDRRLLFENRKNLRHEMFADASAEKKYLEIAVSKASGGYSKGSGLKFERFVDGVVLAIEQARLFETDFERLKTNLGSCIGVLLEEMKAKE